MKLFEAIVQNHRLIGHPIHGKAALARDKRIVDVLPSGSGFDSGTDIVFVSDEKIIFKTSFHHMVDGDYCGWTEHKVILSASLCHGFTTRVTGRDKNGIKDYICDVFNSVAVAGFDWL